MFHVVLGLVPVLLGIGLLCVIFIIAAGILSLVAALTITIVRAVKKKQNKDTHIVSLIFSIIFWIIGGMIIIPTIIIGVYFMIG